MAHPYDASFSYSQYHEALQAPPQPPPITGNMSMYRKPRKATKQRKRNALPGPAGVWFLTQNSKKHHNSNSNNSSNNNNNNDEEEEDYASPHMYQQQESDGPKAPTVMAVSSHPAWTAMQCDLNWLTPDVPLSVSMASRYHRLRPNIPSDYLLLPQILNDSGMWKLPAHQKLVVLVHSVACHHDDIWTVELHDDTGASIKAWIAPGFVQSEKQHNSEHHHEEQRYIRPGYAWCIEGASLMLQNGILPGEDYEEESNATKRMLLVRQDHITRVWHPSSQDDISAQTFNAWLQEKATKHGPASIDAALNIRKLHNPNDEGCTQEREALKRLGSHHDNDNDEEEEEEEDEMDRFHKNQTHRSGLLPVREDEEAGEIGGPKIMSLHAIDIQPSQLAQTKLASADNCEKGSDRRTQIQPTTATPVHRAKPLLKTTQHKQHVRPNPVTDPRNATNHRIGGLPDQDHVGRQEARPRRVSMTEDPQPLMECSPFSPELRAISGKENALCQSERHHQFPSSHPASTSHSQISTMAQLTPNRASQGLEQISANGQEEQTLRGLSLFAAKASDKQKSRTYLPEFAAKSAKPRARESHTDLSQFSANAGKPSAPGPVVCTQTSLTHSTHQDSSSINGPGGTQVQSQLSQSVLPQKRAKEPNSSKKKVPRYGKSPPKPSAAKLWSSMAVLEDGTGLLDLSSSEEETDEVAKQQPSVVKKPEPTPQPKTWDDQSHSPNFTKAVVNAAACNGRENGTSLLQAVCKPGIEWIGLSDEEE
jgi:hypothetical protein